MTRALAVLLLLLPALARAQDSAPPPEDTPPVEAAAPVEGNARPDAIATEETAPEAPPAEDLATIPVQEAIAAPPAADEATQLDEMVVTAQKVKQPLRKVPLSITALGGDFISATGAADLADVSLYVPNVRVDADDLGSPQVFIRGFGTNSFNPSFEAAVAFVQDELYFGRPGYFTESMFDIDRIEVLRGPQGTLFGKNSIAGVFNVTTRGPEQGFAADGRIFGGEDGELRYEAGIGGFVTDWLGGRVAGLHREQDGELRNQFLDRYEDELTQDAARVKGVIYAPGGLRLELLGAESQTEAPFWPFQLKNLDADTRDYLDDFDPAIEDDATNFVTSFDTQGFIEKGSETASAKAEWEVGQLGPLQDFVPVLVIGTSTFHIDQLNELDVSPADIARLDNHEDHEQVSAELRFSGSADGLFGLGTRAEFVAGGFYYDSSYVLLARAIGGEDIPSWSATADFAQLASGDITAPGLGVPVLPPPDNDYYQFDYVQDVESMAAFGQVTWYLTDAFAITPGVRFSEEKKRVDTKGEARCGPDGQGPICVMETILETQDYDYRDLERNENDVSPKLALQYFAENGINYYASYARGYKSGGYNSISFGRQCDDPGDPTTCRVVRPDELEYEPEKAETYELGTRAVFFERTLSVNLTGYRTEFENLQVLAFNGVFFDVSNAGAAESQGLELDFQWQTPWEPLRLIGSGGLMDAKYTSYPNAPAPISQGLEQEQDLAGKRIAFTPKATATLTPTLTFLLGDYVTSVAADVLYQGDQYTDTDLDPNTYVPAYTKVAGRVTFGHAGGRWSVGLGGTNLTDERVLNQVTDAPFFPGTYFAQQAGGRQLFATLTLSL